MPRNAKNTAELQKQRQKLKEKAQKYVPGTVSLQVLGSGAKGAPRSLYVFTDQFRYLFNCGEGTQRLAHEHKMKLSKLEHIFITNLSWENIGGLPGVALTIQDVGVPEITLHGPAGTDEIFTATQRFVVLKDMAINMESCTAGDFFEDSVMTVEYVPLVGAQGAHSINCSAGSTSPEHRAGSSHHESDDDVDYYAHERKRKKRRNSRERSYAAKRRKPEILGLQENVAMNYICQLKPKPGSLCLERCVEQGVPPGPLLGKLKAGIDVTLENGTVVKSCDVRLPDDPGPIFIVVDCPLPSYIDSLVKNPMFARHQSSAKSEVDIAFLVVHFTPSSVMEDPRYQKWMQEFFPSTYHLVINDSNSCMGSVAVHRIQQKLNLLHPDIFPLLKDKGIPLEELSTLQNGKSQSEDVKQNGKKGGEAESEQDTSDVVDRTLNSSLFSVIQARTFCTVHLRPRRCIDRQGELKMNPSVFLEETYSMEGMIESLNELKKTLMQSNADTDSKFPRILFLGTGSCIPNKTRNTSGILVYTSEEDCILLDCGEGTYGQLVRFYGPENVDSVMTKLRAVFVSHLHADHHIGLIGLLKGHKEALHGVQSPLYLIAPRQIMSWLNLYHRCFEPVIDEFVLIPNAEVCYDGHTLEKKLYSQLLSELHMTNISSAAVQHCPNAFGIALQHNDGWKLTYSGDTMPCDRLIQLGKNSDLLIHEATMEDDLQGEARSKLHSTTSQAIEVGKRMGAKFTLLTHFSQRYAKMPRLNENFTHDVGIAFDNMEVTMGQLPLLPLMYNSLILMFAEHYEEMEQKTARRLRRKELERQLLHS